MSKLIPFNRRSPISSVSGFEDFYNMLDDFFNEPLSTRRSLRQDTFKLDIKDKGDQYVIEAELPGVKKDEINLEINDGRLSISIEREEKKEKEEKNYLHRERRYSSMRRSIYLGDVKEEDINARLEEGVLSIEIPKKEGLDETKRIPIE
ncbi:MAG TPA: Hsp20/alpha crystallin family protein [Tissierellaceae bacterium]|nr:Hsp20/alpha crystallin family protein [Tissierellaceae bacterium]